MKPKRVEPRRRDRAQEDTWIQAFLTRAPFGFLATVAERRPLLNSNLFVYEASEHAIYLHTARTGRTPEQVARGGPAAFSAAVMGRLLPAPEALEFSVEFASVVCFGRIEPVPGPQGKRAFMEALMRKYAPHLEPGRDYRAITDEELARTAVHRLRIDAWSGKEKVADADFPGAFAPRVPRPPILPEAGAS